MNGSANLSTISDAYKSLPRNSGLCVALARCEIMSSRRDLAELNEETMDSFPRAFICQVFRDTMDNVIHRDLTWPSDHICDYHDHERNPEVLCCALRKDCFH